MPGLEILAEIARERFERLISSEDKLDNDELREGIPVSLWRLLQ